MTHSSASRQLARTLAAGSAVALVIALHYLDFAAANVNQGIGWSQVARYAFLCIIAALAVAFVLRSVLWRTPLWRILTALVPVAFLFFAYHEVNQLLGWRSVDAAVNKLAAGELGQAAKQAGELRKELLVRLGAWTIGLFAIFLLGLRLLRSPRTPTVMLVLTTAMAAVPMWTLLSDAEGFALEMPSPAPSVHGESRGLPNLYWLVADGYPSRRTLIEDFQFDNSSFYDRLATHGFVVNDRTRANYPATIYSVATTLSMRYLLEESTPPEKVKDLKVFREIVRGKNPTVTDLRQLGYRYIHFSNGYDFLTQCGGYEDVCLQGTRAINELDVALLGRTPILDALMLRSLSGASARSVFAFGAFDEFGQMLKRIREVERPYFVYAHVIAPHPPMRFDADCRIRSATPDLKEWKPENRVAFVDQLKCVNHQLASVTDEILLRDPTAIVVLQSDHGSAFRGQFVPGADTSWNGSQIAERLGVLNAMRVPEACRASVQEMRSLVNTYAVVLACIHASKPVLAPDRYFNTPYDNSPNFGKVFELR